MSARTDRLKIHHFLPYSRANGPGVRAVLWVQGCTLGCPGCYNPLTHPPQGGQWLDIDAIMESLRSLGRSIEGLTVSGGEPFQQPSALLALFQRVRAETDLSVLVFSGFTLEEIQRIPEGPDILEHIDVLIAGRYQENLRLARGLMGSANKKAHLLTPRYSMKDLQAVPDAEVILTPTGEIMLSGIENLIW
ncbi:MAG: radical SAM protein [Anaerolineales bacterium]|nr:radical SAM protein [Anaerolineales bacterium]